MRLVQFELSNGERRVGVVEQGLVREVQDARTRARPGAGGDRGGRHS